MSIWQIALAPFTLTFLVGLILFPLTIWFFGRMGWLVDPKKSPHPAHTHKEPVPKGGGVGVVIAMSLAAAVFLPMDHHLKAILVALWINLIIGIVDDVRGVSPYLRFGGQLFSAGIVIASGVGISFLSNPLGGLPIDLSHPRIGFELLGEHREIWLLPDLFALLWIPFLMNSVNFASGVDGQISGVVTIASIVVGFLSLTFSADITQWPVAVMAFSLAGVFAALTIFHVYPQKIMPGYSATSSAGFLLGVISILATAKIGAAMVVLGVPVVDAVYSISRRILSGKAPWWGDRGHLHHKLMKMGLPRWSIAIIYWLATVVLGLVAILTTTQTKIFAILGLSLVIGLFLLWTHFGTSPRRFVRDSG